MHKSREPSQEYLRERFDYDAERGVLVWKAHNPRQRAKPGTVAGNVTAEGYRSVSLHGAQYLAHRLVWVLENGPIPGGMEIDHLNRVRSDNRLVNLRLADRAVNCANKPTKKNLPVGVKISSKGSIAACIRINGKQTHLGTYKTAQEAGDAYALAYELHYGRPFSV